jgi:hypothetical protein
MSPNFIVLVVWGIQDIENSYSAAELGIQTRFEISVLARL